MEYMVFQNSTSPAKKFFKAMVSAGKVMTAVSWHIHGIIHVDFTPRGAMVTAVTIRRRYNTGKKLNVGDLAYLPEACYY
jgi:hypothetical protein